MDAKQRLSVLLDDPSSLATSLMKIARVVAQALKEHPTDVAQKVRYGGGIVVRDVPAIYAKEIARGLAALGLGSFLVAQEAFEVPPRPRRVGQFEFGPDGVVIAQLLRPPEKLAWADVLALHAHASIDSTSGEDDEAPARRGGDMTQLSEAARGLLGALREFEDRERARVILGLDVIVSSGPSSGPAKPVLYRMTSIEAGIYGSLSHLSTIAIENYLSLVRELTVAAPASVLVPAGTRRFVLDHDFRRVLHSKREELESVNAWLLQAVAQGLAASEHEPEDLSDEGLEDAEDAIPVAPSGTGDDADADEIDDAELDDEDEGEEPDAPLDHSAYDDDSTDDLDDTDLADDVGSSDPELAETMKLFDKTGRFKAADVKAILADVKHLEATEVEAAASGDPDADPEVREAMGFFETQPSGKWEVKQVLEADQAERDEREGDASGS